MKQQLSSEILQRRMMAGVIVAALGGGVLGGLMGHASGVNDERNSFIDKGVTCDITVAAGENEGKIQSEIVDKLGAPIDLLLLDSNKVLRTPDNSPGFPDPRKYPEASDILQGIVDLGTCKDLGGIAVNGS